MLLPTGSSHVSLPITYVPWKRQKVPISDGVPTCAAHDHLAQRVAVQVEQAGGAPQQGAVHPPRPCRLGQGPHRETMKRRHDCCTACMPHTWQPSSRGSCWAVVQLRTLLHAFEQAAANPAPLPTAHCPGEKQPGPLARQRRLLVPREEAHQGRQGQHPRAICLFCQHGEDGSQANAIVSPQGGATCADLHQVSFRKPEGWLGAPCSALPAGLRNAAAGGMRSVSTHKTVGWQRRAAGGHWQGGSSTEQGPAGAPPTQSPLTSRVMGVVVRSVAGSSDTPTMSMWACQEGRSRSDRQALVAVWTARCQVLEPSGGRQ